MEILRQHSVLDLGDTLENVHPLTNERRTVSHFPDHVAFKVFAVRGGQETKKNWKTKCVQTVQTRPVQSYLMWTQFTPPIPQKNFQAQQ